MKRPQLKTVLRDRLDWQLRYHREKLEAALAARTKPGPPLTESEWEKAKFDDIYHGSAVYTIENIIESLRNSGFDLGIPTTKTENGAPA